jgi:hypothetical protein
VLLSAGANIDLKDLSNKTALSIIDSDEIVQLLLAKGAIEEIEQKNNF